MGKGRGLHVVKEVVLTQPSKYLERETQQMFKGQLVKVLCYH